MFKQELFIQIVRFGAVGGLVTGFFMLLNRLLGPKFGKTWAFVIAYPPAVTLHYCLNKWWTFDSQRGDANREFSEYLVLTGVVFVIQLIMFQLLTRYTRLPAWLASGVATMAQMVVSFVAMRTWVFVAKG